MLLAALLMLGGLLTTSLTPATGQEAKPAAGDVILATTTSTADTGLLDAMAPLFEDATGSP